MEKIPVIDCEMVAVLVASCWSLICCGFDGFSSAVKSGASVLLSRHREDKINAF